MKFQNLQHTIEDACSAKPVVLYHILQRNAMKQITRILCIWYMTFEKGPWRKFSNSPISIITFQKEKDKVLSKSNQIQAQYTNRIEKNLAWNRVEYDYNRIK